MTNFIPLFPLNVVVFPDEPLNLHIFEPRYIQLINDCLAQKQAFGIIHTNEKGMQEVGTLVEIVELSQRYENGEMDIKTKGDKVFRILHSVQDLPDKLYGGAIVHYPENHLIGNAFLGSKLLNLVRQLHAHLLVNKKMAKPDEALLSYDLAHHAGLSTEQEYELLTILNELQRQEYLRQHLTQVLSMLKNMDSLKERIQLNGHFKNLKGF